MKTSIFKSLYVQVLTAIAIGILLGHFYPELGAQMKPFGDAFVKLIKMVIAPVIFCTVVTGIAGMESMKAVGRTGAVALLYFEVVSTAALIIGLLHITIGRLRFHGNRRGNSFFCHSRQAYHFGLSNGLGFVAALVLIAVALVVAAAVLRGFARLAVARCGSGFGRHRIAALLLCRLVIGAIVAYILKTKTN